MAPPDEKIPADENPLKQLGSGVDLNTFEQILEMDDSPEDRDFSRSIVFSFFSQAKETFDQMDEALKNRKLEELSDLGHFLKGSSATLGLVKVRDWCEKIQRYGKKETEDGNGSLDEDVCLERLEGALINVKGDYEEVKKSLKTFFGEE